MRDLLRPSLNWLLVFVPAAIVADRLLPGSPTLVFFAAAIGIVPLAGLLGDATDQLSRRTGQGIGALLNATFGNAAELIIALFALAEGLRDVVKASLTGSIISNLLLVLGGSLLAGGARYKIQRFNQTAARIRATMLMLAAIALIVPAAYRQFPGVPPQAGEGGLSVLISIVLFLTYGLELVFSLHTHRDFFSGAAAGDAAETPDWSTRKSLGVLAAATALVAWLSEILVSTIEQAAHSLGMTSLFVGVIIVGVIGNAAEHATAVMMARKNKMDLAVGIAIGSSIQVALFVAPVLVFASYVLGPQPMDLAFSGAEVVAIVLAVWIAGQIAGDGESNWLEGVQLIAVYLLFAIVFYFVPGGAGHP